MSIQQQHTLGNHEQIVNTREKQALDPYHELRLRQFVKILENLKRLTETEDSRIKLPQRNGMYSFSKQWIEGGYLPLDSDGMEYLQVLGFSEETLSRVINAGVSANLILRKIRNGVSYIGLRESETRQ